VASAAINELAIVFSGLRTYTPFLELDLLGPAEAPRQTVADRRAAQNPSCVECAKAGRGDKAEVERYLSPGLLEQPEASEA
jgi:hypothetical protein